MNVNDLFDYETTTITPEEAERAGEFIEGLLSSASRNHCSEVHICDTTAPSIVIIMSAGICALEEAGRIKA